ncbi:DUF1146 family protein [Spiroplasma sp. AdecLV25b]|uniref:DUF1146 family protein n=1 Tax=Spiroplasma sp. AdecLV25b TaxID=3027162 RepID=UPI0027DEF47C|nr:DUF1146 family protein [Spiroplasma sp. AdecLV25b]
MVKDPALVKWVIEISIYLFSFIASAFAIRSVPFNKFLNHNRVKEAWVLYMLTTLVFTYCIGTLIINFIGLDIWFS